MVLVGEVPARAVGSVAERIGLAERVRYEAVSLMRRFWNSGVPLVCGTEIYPFFASSDECSRRIFDMAIKEMGPVWYTGRDFDSRISRVGKKDRRIFRTGDEAYDFCQEKLSELVKYVDFEKRPIAGMLTEWGDNKVGLSIVDFYFQSTPSSDNFNTRISGWGMTLSNARSFKRRYPLEEFRKYLNTLKSQKKLTN